MHHAQIDRLSCRNTPIHRLDARVKLIAVIVFTIAVISLPATSISILFCYAVLPFSMLAVGRVPLRFVLKQIIITTPFIAVLALSSLFYDRQQTVIEFGPFTFHLTVGSLRCLSLLCKFIVSLLTLISLIATTTFTDLLTAMSQLKVPQVLVTQLGFLYRYIFLLVDRASHIIRARRSRSLRYLGIKTELATAAAMIGNLLTSSIDTATHVHLAMQARLFIGNVPSLRKSKLTIPDFIFLAAFTAYLITLYLIRAGG